MIDVPQFRTRVVQPMLHHLATFNGAMNSPAAENLLVGTAIQESHLTYLAQLGGGPALGVMQIEPQTHDDVWTNYLNFRTELAAVVTAVSAGADHGAQQLVWNIGYSVVMARLIYWRQSAPMPTDATDLDALGHYWKDHYNTAGGGGHASEWVANYQKYAEPA